MTSAWKLAVAAAGLALLMGSSPTFANGDDTDDDVDVCNQNDSDCAADWYMGYFGLDGDAYYGVRSGN